MRSCSLDLVDALGYFIPNVNSKYFWIDTKFKVYIGLATKRYFIQDNPLVWSNNYEDILRYTNSDNLVFKNKSIVEDEDIYWFSQGVFVTINPQTSRDFSNTITSIQGIDKFSLLDGQSGANQLLGIYKIPAGTKFGNAIRDILLLETATGVIDPIPPYIEPVIMSDDNLLADQVLPFDIVKNPSEYIGSLIITLTDTFGCDCFYDTNGRLTITPGTADLSYSQEAPIWDFSDKEREYSNPLLMQDTVNTINIVKVVSANIKDKIYEHTEMNTNPLSDTSIGNAPEKSRYIQSDTCFNQERCRDLAIYHLNKLSRVQKNFNFESTILPHLNINKVISISDKYYNFQKERFIIQGLQIPFSSQDKMSIASSNIASLPYYNMTTGK